MGGGTSHTPREPQGIGGLHVVLCGTGNATHCLVGLFALQRHEDVDITVDIFSRRSHARFAESNQENGGLIKVNTFDGEQLVGKVNMVTDDAAKCFPDADLVLMPLHGAADEAYLNDMAPYLKEGSMVFKFGPAGTTGFFISARDVLCCKNSITDKDIVLCAVEVLPFNGRLVEFGKSANLLGIKDEVNCIATSTQHLLNRRLGEESTREEMQLRTQHALNQTIAYKAKPHYKSLEHVVCADLTPAIVHVPIIYSYFHSQWDGVTPLSEIPMYYSTADANTQKCYQAISQECLAIKHALQNRYTGLDLGADRDVTSFFQEMYGSQCSDNSCAASIMRTCPALKSRRHPMKPSKDDASIFQIDYEDRFIAEDVPYQMLMVKGIASLSGVEVETPTIDRIIGWAQKGMGKEYLIDGKLIGRDIHDSRCPQRYGCSTVDGYLSFVGCSDLVAQRGGNGAPRACDGDGSCGEEERPCNSASFVEM